MIYSLHGELIHTEPNLAVVECGGVGYACRTTMNTLKKIGGSGEVRLFTQLNVREDAIDLFGFADTAELQAFRQLTSISGVGPKAALAILSDLTPSKLALCITTGDSKTLTRSPGIATRSPSVSLWSSRIRSRRNSTSPLPTSARSLSLRLR